MAKKYFSVKEKNQAEEEIVEQQKIVDFDIKEFTIELLLQKYQNGFTSLVIGGGWHVSGSGPFYLDAANSRIECTIFESFTPHTYKDVVCNSMEYASNTNFRDVIASEIVGDNGSFRNITVVDDIGFNASYSIFGGVGNEAIKTNIIASFCNLGGLETDSLLILNHSQYITIYNGLKINNYFNASGDCDGLTYIEKMSSDSVNLSGNGIFDFLVITNLKLKGNIPVNATNSIDNGNNSGINFTSIPAPRQLYWVNGTGNWNDINHWSTTSGGPGGDCIPSFMDDIYFDSNSFNSPSDTVYASIPILYGRTMTWTDSAVVVSGFNSNFCKLSLNGSIKFSQGVQWLLDDYIIDLKSDSAYNEISMPGATVRGDWRFSGTGDWFIKSSIGNPYYNFWGKNIYTNGNSISFEVFMCGNCNLDTSLINSYSFQGYNLDGDSSTIITTSFTVNDSSHIKNVTCVTLSGQNTFIENAVIVSGTNNSGIYSSNNHFGKATFIASNCTLTAINIFDTLTFATLAQEVDLSGLATVNNLFQVNTTPGFPIRIQSTNGGVISKSSDTICIDNVYLKNISAVGGAHFYAGDNSVDLGGNSGWVFNSCPNINDINEPIEDIFLNIFPNPSSGNMILNLSDIFNGSYSYTLSNFNGQVIMKNQIRNSTTIINREGISNGIYFLSLTSDDGSKQFMRKIVFN